MTLYLDLARKLRVVQAGRADRAAAGNPEKVAAGGLGLDRVLTVLDGGEADALLQETQARVTRLLADAEKQQRRFGSEFAVGIEDTFLPRDPFDRELVRFFGGGAGAPHPSRETMARAIVTALASATDEGGVLTREQIAELGPHALELKDIVKRAPVTTVARLLLKYSELDDRVMKKVALSKPRETFLERMPVLNELTQLLGGPDSLAGFTLASVQHLFPSTLGLYDALVDNGLPKNTAGVGGKNYSANADVVARMHADGFEVAHESMPVPQEAGLDAEQLVLEMADDELYRLFAGVDPREKTPRFLLLDEGGKLIKALHEHYPRFAHLCVCVEQTDRGIQVIEEMRAQTRAIAILANHVDVSEQCVREQRVGLCETSGLEARGDAERARYVEERLVAGARVVQRDLTEPRARHAHDADLTEAAHDLEVERLLAEGLDGAKEGGRLQNLDDDAHAIGARLQDLDRAVREQVRVVCRGALLEEHDPVPAVGGVAERLTRAEIRPGPHSFTFARTARIFKPHILAGAHARRVAPSANSASVAPELLR